uniref:Uncharacterized protein LOC111102271 n=1 Tax=Crassostrea virginica TaxID=6565 RepID=A0A8B8AGL9_CRAVI|nr:uncharacterized protein LOC111102271 [Crassostrea virginica]
MKQGKEGKKMDKCSSGYFGDFCNRTCPAGRYGPLCGGVCTPKCSVKKCHHVYGCGERNTTTVQAMVSGKDSILITDMPLTKSGTKSNRFQITTKNVLSTLKGNMPFTTVKPEAKNEFQATHMLVGIGALISLFLFIIIIQLCRKSSSSKSRNITRQSNDDTTLNSGSLNQGNIRGYNVISEQLKEHSYQPFDVQYAEINESLEMHIPNNSDVQNGDEISVLLYKNLPSTERFDDTKDKLIFKDTCMQEEAKMDSDASKTYLNPVFISGVSKSSWKEKDKMYINVEQVS